MARTKPLNYLDQVITNLSVEFQKIPNYAAKMQDPELKSIHTFVAVGMAGITESRNLVVASFVPATNKQLSIPVQ